MRNVFLLSTALLLAACGSKVEGTYSLGVNHLKFSSNGKVITNVLGAGDGPEVPYTVDGDKINFRFPGGENIVLTINKDGSLDSALGKFTKK